MASELNRNVGGHGRGWQWLRPRMVFLVSMIYLDLFSPGESAAVRPTSVYPPYTPCGNYRTCDLRTQFCDTALNTCGSCDDVCSQSRIAGDDMATEMCKQICGWYFLFTATTTTTSLSPTLTPTVTQPDALHSMSNAAAKFSGLMLLIILVLVVIITVMVSVVAVAFFKRECFGRHKRRGSRQVITEDPTEHCRSVDDTKNLKPSSNGDLRQSSMPVGVGTHSSFTPLLLS